MRTMRHPDLPGRTWTGPERAARVRRKSGWIDVDDDQARPATSATKDVWVDHASALGIDTDGLTKDQLIDAVDQLTGNAGTDDS